MVMIELTDPLLSCKTIHDNLVFGECANYLCFKYYDTNLVFHLLVACSVGMFAGWLACG